MPLVHVSGAESQASARQRKARKIKPQYAEGQLVKVARAESQPEAEFIESLLLEEGIPSMLRRSGGFDVPDFLAAGPRDITLYSRTGCHLCEEAKKVIAPMLSEFGATLREVNIEEDAVLEERYGWDIPIIFIGARKAAKHRVDPAQFRRQVGAV